MNVNPYPPCEVPISEPTCGVKPPKGDCCDRHSFQIVDVSLPLELCPATEVGRIETECFGEPCIQCEQEPCGSNCSIIITQSVKIRIPVKFGVKTIQGNSFIQCGEQDCRK